MADAPIERLLKDIIKKKEPKIIEMEADKPTVKKKLKKVAIKKKPYSPRPDNKPKPSTSGYKTPEWQIIPSYLSPVAKKALKGLGWKEGDDSPKRGGKAKRKLKKTEGEKLQEGYWEKWRKKLDYAEDEDSD